MFSPTREGLTHYPGRGPKIAPPALLAMFPLMGEPHDRSLWEAQAVPSFLTEALPIRGGPIYAAQKPGPGRYVTPALSTPYWWQSRKRGKWLLADDCVTRRGYS